MRHTVQVLYVNMVNSVTGLNAAVAELDSRPLETALAARSATLGGGGQGGDGWRSATPPFTNDPPYPDSPVSVDRCLYY
jgi:hypothetical protein